MRKGSEQILSERDVSMANKHINWFQHHMSLGNLQINSAMKYGYTPIRMAKIPSTDSIKY